MIGDKKKAEMDDAFHDSHGNPVSLFELVRSEPEWAASRIREGKRIQADNERLRQVVLFYSKENERLRELMRDLVENAKGGDCGEIIVIVEDFDAIERDVFED